MTPGRLDAWTTRRRWFGRLRRPDPDAVAATGAQCLERGVYEVWAPGGELTEDRMVDLPYPARHE